MVKIIWRSDPVCNPVGYEARIIEIDGERTLEVMVAPNLSFIQRMKAIWSIIFGKSYIISTIYGEMPNE